MRFWAVLTAILSFSTAYAGDVYFRNMGPKEGLSHMSVLAIWQDETGRMWFGTEEGLTIYDGCRMRAFKSHNIPGDSIALGNKVVDITGDRNGHVWFIADNALYRYDMTAERFGKMAESDVGAVALRGDSLWYSIRDSIFVADTGCNNRRLYCKLHDDSRIMALNIDSGGQCLAGTEHGLYACRDGAAECIIAGVDVASIFEDSHRNRWIATADGAYIISADGSIVRFGSEGSRTALASDIVRTFCEDDDGCIWIGTFRGLHRYDPKTDSMTLYRHGDGPGSLNHSSVFALCIDSHGTLWTGTYYGGVSYCNTRENPFFFISAGDDDKSLSFPYIGHMVEDKDGNLWIGTEGGGLNCLNRNNKSIRHFVESTGGGNYIAHNNVKSLVYDERRERLYIGTHTGGLSVYDIRNDRFRNPFLERPELLRSIGDRINCMELHGDTLLFATQHNLYKACVTTLEIEPCFASGNYYGSQPFMTDAEGFIWVAAAHGIWRIAAADENNRRFWHYGERGLGEFGVQKFCQAADGRIYIGTGGSGLFIYEPESDTFRGYDTQNSGIVGDYCYDIAQTAGGILIMCDKGLSFFDPQTGKFGNIEFGPAVPVEGFNIGCGIAVCRNGEIFVGGTNGLASFFEEDMLRGAEPRKLYFSALSINGETVYPDDSSRILSRTLRQTEMLKLKHRQNNISVEFASDDPRPPLRRPLYEYRLQGNDDRWNTTTGHTVTYTNLPPGRYRLQIRERRNDVMLHEPETIEMQVRVFPPFYATTTARILYFLAAAALLYVVLRVKQRQFNLRTSLEFEKKEKLRIEETNRAKLQFVSSVSHEFRTPLTLIVSQLELMMNGNFPKSSLQEKLQKVYANAGRLQKLVTEFLDFGKLEQGHVRLHLCRADIVPFLNNIHAAFRSYATARGIDYRFTAEQERIVCPYDALQMEKVVYNLLSNAFKYVGDSGVIELRAARTESEVAITVTDTGKGISERDIGRIFERFYRAEDMSDEESHVSGTGIGLATVKYIAELHHGSVSVESQPGTGSAFTVRIPADAELPDGAQTEAGTEEENVQPSDITAADVATVAGECGYDEAQCTMLVVEDNDELRGVICELFSPTYRILQARNGREGLETARSAMPDIIVSDIMMPEMSGLDMCRCIKNDLLVCHIPVLLLTALGSAEQSITGLKAGADDYVAKPFNTAVLAARCNTLVMNRRMVRMKYRNDTSAATPLPAASPLDRRFLEKIESLVEANIDNPDFGVEEITREAAVGRSALFVKFKALTGMTPNEFVLNYKLRKAASWLLNEPDMQIADITYRLGFGSPRYFSKCFKARFDVTPSEYRKHIAK